MNQVQDHQTATTIVKQIGMQNRLAISGGRQYLIPSTAQHGAGVRLPVSNGHHVEIIYEFNDTYTIRGYFERKGKRIITHQFFDVYCDQLGEIAYKASCYHDKKGD